MRILLPRNGLVLRGDSNLTRKALYFQIYNEVGREKNHFAFRSFVSFSRKAKKRCRNWACQAINSFASSVITEPPPFSPPTLGTTRGRTACLLTAVIISH